MSTLCLHSTEYYGTNFTLTSSLLSTVSVNVSVEFNVTLHEQASCGGTLQY